MFQWSIWSHTLTVTWSCWCLYLKNRLYICIADSFTISYIHRVSRDCTPLPLEDKNKMYILALTIFFFIRPSVFWVRWKLSKPPRYKSYTKVRTRIGKFLHFDSSEDITNGWWYLLNQEISDCNDSHVLIQCD